MRRALFIFTLFFIFLTAGTSFTMSRVPRQPGQPAAGYGSTDNYICSGYSEFRTGNWYDPWGGDWC